MARGWRLTGAAWRVMRRDRTMIAIALLGTACGIAGAALVLYLGGSFTPSRYSRAHFALVWLIALYPLTFVSVFFNVALASAAAAHLDGGRLSLGTAFRAAYDRIDRIALWSLLSAGIGLLISEIANRLPGGAKLVGWLMGAAWGLATIFAVPLLALEDAGPIEALRGSAHLVKSRWGEGLTGMVGIGAWTVIVAFPAGIVIGVGAGLTRTNQGAGVAMIAVGLTALVVVAAMATATRQVFAVALFRYATGGGTGGFATADLEHPFALKKKGRRTHWIAWVALGLIVALVALAAALHPRAAHRTGGEGYFHASFLANAETTAAIRDGMPVLYRGRKAGYVVDHQLEGSTMLVDFYVEPTLHWSAGASRMELVSRRRHPYIRIFPSRSR